MVVFEKGGRRLPRIVQSNSLKCFAFCRFLFLLAFARVAFFFFGHPASAAGSQASSGAGRGRPVLAVGFEEAI